MGDVLAGVFGGGGRESVNQTLDPTTQALNTLRHEQLAQLFGQVPYSNFAQPRSDIYTASPAVNNLFNTANVGPDLSNLLSFEDYKTLGLDQTQNYINQIAKPEILSTAALQGLEYGGAVPEAIAKATAQVGLPFVQGLPQASTALTLAGPQANVLGAQKATALFPLADYGRALSEQDLLRQQGVVTAGLTGLPYQPSTDTSSKKSSEPLFNFFGQG